MGATGFIPKYARGSVSKRPDGAYGLLWGDATIATYTTYSRARTASRRLNSFLGRLTPAHAIGSSNLVYALASFLEACAGGVDFKPVPNVVDSV